MFQDKKNKPAGEKCAFTSGFQPTKEYFIFSVFSFKPGFFFTVSVLFACMFITGLPQYPVPEAEDTDHTEGEEDSGQTGSEEADTHWAWRLQTPL